MKPYKIALLFLFSAFLFTGLYAGDKEEVKRKIKEANQKMLEDMKSGNYQACLDMYTEDAINMPSYAKMNRGKDAIKEHFDKEKEMGAKILDAKFETVEVFGENDMFVEIGTYDFTMEIPNMDEPMNDVGKYITVWRQMPDGSLKIQSDIWNTDINYFENQMVDKPADSEITGGKK